MNLTLPIIDDRGVRDPSKCGPCAGRCCKDQPGAAWPEDFDDMQSVVNAVKSGKWVIRVTLQGVPLWIRPATVHSRGHFDKMVGGRCVMLTDTGCSLGWTERPAQCRWVTPIEYGKCRADAAHQDGPAIDAWTPHWPVILAALGGYEMPPDFDVETERRRLVAGGCCGSPSSSE